MNQLKTLSNKIFFHFNVLVNILLGEVVNIAVYHYILLYRCMREKSLSFKL